MWAYRARRGTFPGTMRTLKTSEAATLLNVSPNTLRSWERRFGYPRPKRSPGRHRLYVESDIAALRHALASGLSISSAISVARDGLRGGSDALIGALNSFDGVAADEAMESALGMRSLERSVEEVLLPSLEKLAARYGHDSAQWGFSARWAVRLAAARDALRLSRDPRLGADHRRRDARRLRPRRPLPARVRAHLRALGPAAGVPAGAHGGLAG